MFELAFFCLCQIFFREVIIYSGLKTKLQCCKAYIPKLQHFSHHLPKTGEWIFHEDVQRLFKCYLLWYFNFSDLARWPGPLKVRGLKYEKVQFRQARHY